VWYIAILDVIEWSLEETDRFETCKRDRAARGRHDIDLQLVQKKKPPQLLRTSRERLESYIGGND